MPLETPASRWTIRVLLYAIVSRGFNLPVALRCASRQSNTRERNLSYRLHHVRTVSTLSNFSPLSSLRSTARFLDAIPENELESRVVRFWGYGTPTMMLPTCAPRPPFCRSLRIMVTPSATRGRCSTEDQVQG